jgi:hypothetical protein
LARSASPTTRTIMGRENIKIRNYVIARHLLSKPNLVTVGSIHLIPHKNTIGCQAINQIGVIRGLLLLSSSLVMFDKLHHEDALLNEFAAYCVKITRSAYAVTPLNQLFISCYRATVYEYYDATQLPLQICSNRYDISLYARWDVK